MKVLSIKEGKKALQSETKNVERIYAVNFNLCTIQVILKATCMCSLAARCNRRIVLILMKSKGHYITVVGFMLLLLGAEKKMWAEVVFTIMAIDFQTGF